MYAGSTPLTPPCAAGKGPASRPPGQLSTDPTKSANFSTSADSSCNHTPPRSRDDELPSPTGTGLTLYRDGFPVERRCARYLWQSCCAPSESGLRRHQDGQTFFQRAEASASDLFQQRFGAISPKFPDRPGQVVRNRTTLTTECVQCWSVTSSVPGRVSCCRRRA